MWQSLVRNWLYQAARQHAQAAAAEAMSGAARDAGADAGADPPAEPQPEPAICHVGLVFALGIEAGGLVDRLAGVVSNQGAGFTAREGGCEGRRVVLVEAAQAPRPRPREHKRCWPDINRAGSSRPATREP